MSDVLDRMLARIREKPGVDDTTEICGVRILGPLELDLINIYRPPIRPDESDERQDLFDPTHLPSGDSTIVAGDLNAHHPLWDADCDEADEVGERIATWLDSIGWTTLNDGRPTFTSYRSGGQTAPDAAFCSPSLARRTKWSIGPDLGRDHLPMLLEIRTGGAPPKMIRKTRWSFKKADWLAFQEECEAAFAEAGPEHESVQELATRFHRALEEASRQFREYVSTTLNKHQSLGRVHKTLKMWEGASDDQHRAAESMEDGDRTLVSDRDKANAFNRTYATVSKQVRDRKVDRDTKTRLKASNVKTCHECWGRKSGYCSPFSEE
ncbi:hypothetical protein FJT64_001801 [Amphibalanus amphitrite]|uniref:Endonuclease/exonuclease/phosphatase domain-containing protein n=1 Tax=Amphibalanus amphitrite TaxID=1232801 RepID=A0A6A4WYR6_AMPAM|nr:hypothetical protein FJT64_001801 [Amphibalanus amphitrite]